jgi:hypothetical protein
VRLSAARTTLIFVLEKHLLRELLSNPGFTMSAFAAVAMTAVFAFVFEASFEVVVSMLVLGTFTATAEHVLRLDSTHVEIHQMSGPASRGRSK